jgi:plastocyanin/FtsZ-binding cell division protein ZapB
MLKMIAALTILIVLGVGISQVFGEEYQVQVSGNGFEHSYLAVNSGDTITFVNVGTGTHCISDPTAQPYTELSMVVLSGNYLSHSWTMTSNQTFYERCWDNFGNVVVDVSGTTSDTDMDTVPDYTGDTDVIALQADLAEVTLDLTNALETISILQTQVTDLQSQLANAVVDVSPYTNQIDLLVEERDQWKQLAENWYAVALEQVRVMVEVLGL